MDVLLAQIPGDPIVNNAILGVVALAILDFLLGVGRALADGTFSIDSFTAWVKVHLLFQVLPIILVLTFAQAIGTVSVGGVSLNLLTTAGLLAATTYAATTLRSIVNSINPNAPDPVPPSATGEPSAGSLLRS